ncbi:MAG: diaminopimelate decarboxylase [Veillonellaceae bacterium]|nr:diaminopimelate decarboxylase [Veillonellaceae bacterium]
MRRYSLPCSETRLREIISAYGTPFHLYDERGMRENVRQLQAAFSWHPDFKEYFAVKANANPHLLEILAAEGCGADCSSLPELLLADAVGLRGEEILFSSNNTPLMEYEAAVAAGAIVNVDDVSHLEKLQAAGLRPERICFRYNPGKSGIGNAFIGDPREAKYGMTRPQLTAAIRWAQAQGIEYIGLHTMVVSNELATEALTATAEMMFRLAAELHEETGLRPSLLDLGGGIGVAYRPTETPLDYAAYGVAVRRLYEEILRPAGLGDCRLALECGRVITGSYGWLVMRAIHHKHTYKNYIGADTCMADLMRPGMYGAYHYMTVLGKETAPKTQVYDIVGSLCENNDKFAVDRELPEIEDGDILIVHDTGAHGYAMGFHYNGKLRSRELLLQEDGTVREIRRAETIEDYFATLTYPGLKRSM